jgi:hypothetical protein
LQMKVNNDEKIEFADDNTYYLRLWEFKSIRVGLISSAGIISRYYNLH